jgi:phosphatidylserine/phosphatidylglycerophosphate/cardiolipin synthase-like enzyme
MVVRSTKVCRSRDTTAQMLSGRTRYYARSAQKTSHVLHCRQWSRVSGTDTRSRASGTKKFSSALLITLSIHHHQSYIYIMSTYTASDIAASLDQLEQTIRKGLHDGTILATMNENRKAIVGEFTGN